MVRMEGARVGGVRQLLLPLIQEQSALKEHSVLIVPGHVNCPCYYRRFAQRCRKGLGKWRIFLVECLSVQR